MKTRAAAILIALTLLLPCVCAAVAAQDDYPYSGVAPGVYIVDEWRFYAGECTSFAAWRLNNDNGVDFSNWYGGVRWSNANNWDDAARSLGIAVDNNPAVGAIAQTDEGDFGHVAWVCAVDGDRVTVEEYNYGSVLIDGEYHGTHKYNIRTVDASGFCYIHIKDLAVPDDLPSDLTGDGKLNSRDVIAIMKLILTPGAEVTAASDLNNDGKLNSRDVIALMKLVLTQS